MPGGRRTTVFPVSADQVLLDTGEVIDWDGAEVDYNQEVQEKVDAGVLRTGVRTGPYTVVPGPRGPTGATGPAGADGAAGVSNAGPVHMVDLRPDNMAPMWYQTNPGGDRTGDDGRIAGTINAPVVPEQVGTLCVLTSHHSSQESYLAQNDKYTFIDGLFMPDSANKDTALDIVNMPPGFYSHTLVLKHNSPWATNKNRFWSPTQRDVVLRPGQRAKLIYNNGTLNRNDSTWNWLGDKFWFIAEEPPVPAGYAFEQVNLNASYNQNWSGVGTSAQPITLEPFQATRNIDTFLVYYGSSGSAVKAIGSIRAPHPRTTTYVKVTNTDGFNKNIILQGTYATHAGFSEQPFYVNVVTGTQGRAVYLKPKETAHFVYFQNQSEGMWVLQGAQMYELVP